MGDRNIALSPTKIPQILINHLNKPSRLSQALLQQPIQPWERSFFDIDQLIQPPNQDAHTFTNLTPNSIVLSSLSPQPHPSPSPNNASVKTYQSKNKNILKFVVKLLRDFPDILKECFGHQEIDCLQRVQRYIEDLFKWHKRSPSEHNINQEHLKWLMEERGEEGGQEGSEESQVRSRGVRLAMRHILRRHMRKVTLRNSRCHSKLVYLNALKVYQLRCFHSLTSLRLQS